MKSTLLVSAVLLLTVLASQEARGEERQTPLTRELVPVTAADASLSMPKTPNGRVAPAEPSSRVIYLNRCAGGCTIYPGTDNSRTNRSRIATRTASVPAFEHGDAIWAKTVQCVKETYGRFNIQVTDVDPCAGSTTCATPHWEVIVAGRAEDIGYVSQSGGTVAGVSPFDPRNCSVIDNSMTYAFATVLGPSVDELCWTIAQETAHSFGLDHEFNDKDPMTYLSTGPARKKFQDVDAQCGEYSARACRCSATQNSVTEIKDIFGLAPPSPPTVKITNPRMGASVDPGFVVNVDVADDQGLAQVVLLVDNQIAQTITLPPYAFNAPQTLGSGSHRVEVRATDNNGTSGADIISVVIGAPCTRPSECAQVGEEYTCVGGRCVPGPGSPGGLGETCATSAECSSGFCVTSDGAQVCAEQCVAGTSAACPDGFTCAAAADGNGFCVPGGTGCLGCSTDGGGPTPLAPIGAGLILGAQFLRRRRKPARRA